MAIRHEILARIEAKTGYLPGWVNLGQGPRLKDAAQSLRGAAESNSKKIPILTWDQIAEFCVSSHASIDPDRYDQTEVFVEVVEGMYAVLLEGNSMNDPSGTPSFPHGTLLIVNPHLQEKNGSFVIARVGDGIPNFKKLRFDGDERYLVPLNPDYSPLLVKEKLQVCGVVVGAQQNVRIE